MRQTLMKVASDAYVAAALEFCVAFACLGSRKDP
jgi:hypothetical protein